MDIGWWAFYIWLHLLLAGVLLPGLLWLSRHPTPLPPLWMLRMWLLIAVLLLGLPALLLQPWALDQQLVPWFTQSVQQVLSGAQTLQVQAEGLGSTVALPHLAVQQIQWPLLSEFLTKLAPPSWLWWLLPLVCAVKWMQLLLSYLAARQLRRQASPIGQPLPSCSLPVKSHPAIQSAMLLGLRQPLILLPQCYLQRFEYNQLDLILQHEVCHQQQGDLRSYLAQQVLGGLLWWSPAWHLIAAELNRWRELRCDAVVSSTLPEPYRYAQTLLDCAQLPPGSAAQVLALRWWLQPLLPRRIALVLQPPQKSPGWRGYSLLLTLLLWLMGSLWLAQQWQLAELPTRHAKVRVAALAPLTQLLTAVKANDAEQVRQLLATGAPLNLAKPGEGSALMVAVRQQLPQMVELLLQEGADPNLGSRGDGNALIIAVKRGDPQLVQRLLDSGADVNAAVFADETALINASMRGDLAMVQLLLDRGALINLQVQTPISDGRRWRSALDQAATPAMRDFLLMRGAR